VPSFALILCSVAAVLGTLAAEPLGPDLRLVAAMGMAALTLFAIFHRVPGRLALLLPVLFAVGWTNATLQRRAMPEIGEQRTARYGATLLDETGEADGSTSLTLALDGGLRVSARIRDHTLPAGARLVVRGRLESFDLPRNPGEPSERDIERERGFDARLAGAEILGSDGATEWNLHAWFSRAHEWAHAQLRERLGEPGASVVAGELWGERSALPPDLRAEFQETGTVHVLVTAGLHLGAVAAIAFALLAMLTAPRWAACIAATAIIWSFVAWSGGQLPAVRAATMATAVLAARAFGRATFSWNALALAALALAFARPASVATASFALSFSCVSAIFVWARPLERWIEARMTLPNRVREALVLSIATQAGVWPLGAATFLQLTPYAVAANLAVVPCVAATMALGGAQLALAWCAPLAQAAANCNSWLLAWMLGTVRVVSALPFAAIPVTPAPPWCIAVYDAALLAAPALWRRGATTLAIAIVALATAYVLWPPRDFEPRLRITVLDVGQADAIVVQTPRGHALLVDAGGRLERGAQSSGSVAELVGERIVVPFLLRHGIHALDAIVLSHPHGDHAGGLAPVLRKLRVAGFADGGQRYGGHAYQDALATAREKSVALLYPRAGAEWRTGDGVTLHFLGPSLPFITGSRNDINENSVAFTLRYRSFCMLFTGDAGAAAEERFLEEDADLRCEILKVGHHGSSYSSTRAFIAAVRPQCAIISVGRHNLFGHPAPITLATLHRFGATIYRTDENGAVTILSDGYGFSVSPMLGAQEIASELFGAK
jgi:competence protein ComEC